VARVVNVGAHMDLSMLIDKLTRLKLVIKYDTHDHGATFNDVVIVKWKINLHYEKNEKI
jgi:hypothetical protein